MHNVAVHPMHSVLNHIYQKKHPDFTKLDRFFFYARFCKNASQFILLLETNVAFTGSSKFSLYVGL